MTNLLRLKIGDAINIKLAFQSNVGYNKNVLFIMMCKKFFYMIWAIIIAFLTSFFSGKKKKRKNTD